MFQGNASCKYVLSELRPVKMIILVILVVITTKLHQQQQQIDIKWLAENSFRTAETRACAETTKEKLETSYDDDDDNHYF